MVRFSPLLLNSKPLITSLRKVAKALASREIDNLGYIKGLQIKYGPLGPDFPWNHDPADGDEKSKVQYSDEEDDHYMTERDEDFFDNPDQKYKPGNEDKFELRAIIDGCDEADRMFMRRSYFSFRSKLPSRRLRRYVLPFPV